MSLRPGGQSRDIASTAFAAGHRCAFWNTAGRSAEGVPGVPGAARVPGTRARSPVPAQWLLSGRSE